MFVKHYSYRFAAEILQHPSYQNIYNELIRVCMECPLPVYEGKSVKQQSKDVVQQVMNTFFKLRFMSLGWQVEPYASPDTSEDALRSDFKKTFINERTNEQVTVQIEVEFGNVASSYRNYFKFQLSFSYDMADICVLIVPSNRLANRIDSGVSNFEKTLREIPAAKLSITVPTLVIGLFDEDDEGNTVVPWDVKSIQNDLSIVKGDSRATYEAHCAMIQNYINAVSQIPNIRPANPLYIG